MWIRRQKICFSTSPPSSLFVSIYFQFPFSFCFSFSQIEILIFRCAAQVITWFHHRHPFPPIWPTPSSILHDSCLVRSPIFIIFSACPAICVFIKCESLELFHGMETICHSWQMEHQIYCAIFVPLLSTRNMSMKKRGAKKKRNAQSFYRRKLVFVLIWIEWFRRFHSSSSSSFLFFFFCEWKAECWCWWTIILFWSLNDFAYFLLRFVWDVRGWRPL